MVKIFFQGCQITGALLGTCGGQILEVAQLIQQQDLMKFYISGRCFVKKVFLKISKKFTGKNLCQNVACNFIKKKTSTAVFLYILRNF